MSVPARLPRRWQTLPVKVIFFPPLCYCLITPEIQLLSNQILAQNTKYSQYSYTVLPERWAFVMKWPPFLLPVL